MNRKCVMRVFSLICALGMAAMGGCDQDGGSSQRASSQPDASGVMSDFSEYAAEETTEPNGEVAIPNPPQKPVVDPTTTQFGSPAPQWMREAEMYQNTRDKVWDEAFIKEWMAPYFSFVTSVPWNASSMNYVNNGLKGSVYMGFYHTSVKENLAIRRADGSVVLSDYTDPAIPRIMMFCHNTSETRTHFMAELDTAFSSSGAVGAFFDDVRKPNQTILNDCVTCYSSDHEHDVPDITGSDSSVENYFKYTLPAAYKYVKASNDEAFVMINGGRPHEDLASDDPTSAANLWRYADALMWENCMYDENAWKWCDWNTLQKAARTISPALLNGKKQMILTYFYNKTPVEKRLQAAIETIAYARLNDYLWSDYMTLYESDMDRDLVKELYGYKSGPAGALGILYGCVTDAVTGRELPGATVTAGSESVSTDAQGRFRISIPGGTDALTVSAAGYKEQTVSASRSNLQIQLQPTGGTVYYVSRSGNNNNDGKSPDKAWKSLNFGDAKKVLQPGDTVVVAEGTYKVPNQTFYSASGTAEAPITYIADGDVVIRGAEGDNSPITINGSHVVWSGFQFQGSQSGVGALMVINGSDVEIKNCTFSDTAYFNHGAKGESVAAVAINGENTFFHHNVVGPDVYAKAGVWVSGVSKGGHRIVNNTFWGHQVGDTKTGIGIRFSVSADRDEVKNNLFQQVATALCFDGGCHAQVGGNLASQGELGQEGAGGTLSDAGFMWAESGDFALRQDSGAVNAGVEAGFAYQGDSPDVGAFESAYGEEDKAKMTGSVMYRIFGNSVVFMNSSTEEEQVTIATALGGHTLRRLGSSEIVKTAADGSLTVTVPGNGALILTGGLT